MSEKAKNNETHEAVTKRTTRIQRKINALNKIFVGDPVHANWWRAFKQGPIRFWLEHKFSENGECDLYNAVQAVINDLLKGRLKEATQRKNELRTTLENAVAEQMEAEIQLTIHANVEAELKKMVAFQKQKPEASKVFKHRTKASFCDLCY